MLLVIVEDMPIVRDHSKFERVGIICDIFKTLSERCGKSSLCDGTITMVIGGYTSPRRMTGHHKV